jgi:predicted TIM-barrel fold metal-dependent hydrolase
MIIDGHITLLPNADVGKIIADMDEAGIKRAILSPADHEVAVNNFEGNSRVLKVVGKNPDRFYAYATSNPWFGKNSVETLKAAMKSGAVGLKMLTLGLQ